MFDLTAICKVMNTDEVTGLIKFMGLAQGTLETFKGVNQLKKIFEKITFEDLNDTQKEIFTDSLLELKDYIEKYKNMNDFCFENMGRILLKGIKTEDLLTREYIVILKELTWFDLDILLKLDMLYRNIPNFRQEHHPFAPVENYLDSNYFIGRISANFSKVDFPEVIKKEVEDYPVDLITKSINVLRKQQLIKQDTVAKLNKCDIGFCINFSCGKCL